jgi:hypothetical protein
MAKRRKESEPEQPRKRWSYLLEIGQLGVTKMPYTYARRALGVLYQMQWKQAAVADDIESLKAMASDVPGFTWRITDWNTGKVVAGWECGYGSAGWQSPVGGYTCF